MPFQILYHWSRLLVLLMLQNSHMVLFTLDKPQTCRIQVNLNKQTCSCGGKKCKTFTNLSVWWSDDDELYSPVSPDWNSVSEDDCTANWGCGKVWEEEVVFVKENVRRLQRSMLGCSMWLISFLKRVLFLYTNAKQRLEVWKAQNEHVFCECSRRNCNIETDDAAHLSYS